MRPFPASATPRFQLSSYASLLSVSSMIQTSPLRCLDLVALLIALKHPQCCSTHSLPAAILPQGIWVARLNLSSSRSSTGSSSSNSTIGSKVDVSLDFVVSLRGASTFGFSNTLDLDSLVSWREHSPTSRSLSFRLFSATAASG
jgi:hypothetical protein